LVNKPVNAASVITLLTMPRDDLMDDTKMDADDEDNGEEWY
jgi:hypothetical protein